MNKQALVIALGWALQYLTVQAAEPIIQPSDRPKPNAVQTAPRAKTSTGDRRATAATARRTGIEEGKVREIIEPADRTGMTRRGKPAPRSVVEPQDRPRGIMQPNDRPRGGVQPQDKPAQVIEPEDKPAKVFGPMDRPRGLIEPEDVPRQLMGPGHRSGLIKPTDRPRRDNEKSTPLLPRRPIQDSSVVVPEFTVSDVKAAGRRSATSVPGRGPGSLATGLPGVVVVPDFPGGSQVKVPPLTLPPGPDPRTGRGVAAQSSTTFTTPRIAAQSREVEIEEGSRARRQPPFLRDQRLLGMDYRHFPARSVAECHTACSVEAQCRAWSLRPAGRNNTFDNQDDGPVCWLKTGIPQREYARGYVSGIKPPPPAVGRAVPPPPVVNR